MMWQRYFFISLGVHLIFALLMILIWPRTQNESRLRIFLANAVSSSHYQDSHQVFNGISSFSPNFNNFSQTRENREFKTMAIPNLNLDHLLRDIEVPSNSLSDEIRPHDNVSFTISESQRTYTPTIDDLLIQSNSEQTSASSIQIEWHEGGELISERFNSSMFQELSLETPVTINIKLEVGEDGIVRKIEKTITGQRKIDQAVEAFLNQFIFRPADNPYLIRLTIRLIPGAIFR